jgi:hypothetical protein
MEPILNRPAYTPEQARAVLYQIVAAEEFELPGNVITVASAPHGPGMLLATWLIAVFPGTGLGG